MSKNKTLTRDEILTQVANGTMSQDEALKALTTSASSEPVDTVPLTVLSSVGDLVGKTFSTGSRGYWAGGKVNINGERCQVTITCTVIGSKPKVTA